MKKKIIVSIIFSVFLLLEFLLLFMFSSQNGEESGNLSNTFTLFFAKIFIDDFETISTEQLTVLLAELSTFIRKAAHFSIFFMIGISSYFALAIQINVKKRYTFALAIALVFAIFDETHQYFIPERTASIIDVLIDLSGSGIALIMIQLIKIFTIKRNIL